MSQSFVLILPCVDFGECPTAKGPQMLYRLPAALRHSIPTTRSHTSCYYDKCPVLSQPLKTPQNSGQTLEGFLHKETGKICRWQGYIGDWGEPKIWIMSTGSMNSTRTVFFCTCGDPSKQTQFLSIQVESPPPPLKMWVLRQTGLAEYWKKLLFNINITSTAMYNVNASAGFLNR